MLGSQPWRYNRRRRCREGQRWPLRDRRHQMWRIVEVKERTHGGLNRSCPRDNERDALRNTGVEYAIPGAYTFTVILWRLHSNAKYGC